MAENIAKIVHSFNGYVSSGYMRVSPFCPVVWRRWWVEVEEALLLGGWICKLLWLEIAFAIRNTDTCPEKW